MLAWNMSENYSYTSNMPCPSMSNVTTINLSATILPFVHITSFLKFNPNINPMNISLIFLGGDVSLPSLGRKHIQKQTSSACAHLIACNLELVQLHRNTWVVSWASKLHLLGGSQEETIEEETFGMFEVPKKTAN